MCWKTIIAGNFLDEKTVVGPRCSFRRGKKMWFVTSISGEIAEIGPEVPSIKYQNLRLKWHQNNDTNKISKTSVKEIGYQMFNPIPHPSSWNLKTWRQKSTGRPGKRQWVWKVYPFQKKLLTNDRLHTTHNSYTFNIAVSSSKWKGADQSPLGLLFQRIQSQMSNFQKAPSPPAWSGGSAVPPCCHWIHRSL